MREGGRADRWEDGEVWRRAEGDPRGRSGETGGVGGGRQRERDEVGGKRSLF